MNEMGSSPHHARMSRTTSTKSPRDLLLALSERLAPSSPREAFLYCYETLLSTGDEERRELDGPARAQWSDDNDLLLEREFFRSEHAQFFNRHGPPPLACESDWLAPAVPDWESARRKRMQELVCALESRACGEAVRLLLRLGLSLPSSGSTDGDADAGAFSSAGTSSWTWSSPSEARHVFQPFTTLWGATSTAPPAALTVEHFEREAEHEARLFQTEFSARFQPSAFCARMLLAAETAEPLGPPPGEAASPAWVGRAGLFGSTPLVRPPALAQRTAFASVESRLLGFSTGDYDGLDVDDHGLLGRYCEDELARREGGRRLLLRAPKTQPRLALTSTSRKYYSPQSTRTTTSSAGATSKEERHRLYTPALVTAAKLALQGVPTELFPLATRSSAAHRGSASHTSSSLPRRFHSIGRAVQYLLNWAGMTRPAQHQRVKNSCPPPPTTTTCSTDLRSPLRQLLLEFVAHVQAFRGRSMLQLLGHVRKWDTMLFDLVQLCSCLEGQKKRCWVKTAVFVETWAHVLGCSGEYRKRLAVAATAETGAVGVNPNINNAPTTARWATFSERAAAVVALERQHLAASHKTQFAKRERLLRKTVLSCEKGSEESEDSSEAAAREQRARLLSVSKRRREVFVEKRPKKQSAPWGRTAAERAAFDTENFAIANRETSNPRDASDAVLENTLGGLLGRNYMQRSALGATGIIDVDVPPGAGGATAKPAKPDEPTPPPPSYEQFTATFDAARLVAPEVVDRVPPGGGGAKKMQDLPAQAHVAPFGFLDKVWKVAHQATSSEVAARGCGGEDAASDRTTAHPGLDSDEDARSDCPPSTADGSSVDAPSTDDEHDAEARERRALRRREREGRLREQEERQLLRRREKQEQRAMLDAQISEKRELLAAEQAAAVALPLEDEDGEERNILGQPLTEAEKALRAKAAAEAQEAFARQTLVAEYESARLDWRRRRLLLREKRMDAVVVGLAELEPAHYGLRVAVRRGDQGQNSPQYPAESRVEQIVLEKLVNKEETGSNLEEHDGGEESAAVGELPRGTHSPPGETLVDRVIDEILLKEKSDASEVNAENPQGGEQEQEHEAVQLGAAAEVEVVPVPQIRRATTRKLSAAELAAPLVKTLLGSLYEKVSAGMEGVANAIATTGREDEEGAGPAEPVVVMQNSDDHDVSPPSVPAFSERQARGQEVEHGLDDGIAAPVEVAGDDVGAEDPSSPSQRTPTDENSAENSAARAEVSLHEQHKLLEVVENAIAGRAAARTVQAGNRTNRAETKAAKSAARKKQALALKKLLSAWRAKDKAGGSLVDAALHAKLDQRVAAYRSLSYRIHRLNAAVLPSWGSSSPSTPEGRAAQSILLNRGSASGREVDETSLLPALIRSDFPSAVDRFVARVLDNPHPSVVRIFGSAPTMDGMFEECCTNRAMKICVNLGSSSNGGNKTATERPFLAETTSVATADEMMLSSVYSLLGRVVLRPHSRMRPTNADGKDDHLHFCGHRPDKREQQQLQFAVLTAYFRLLSRTKAARSELRSLWVWLAKHPLWTTGFLGNNYLDQSSLGNTSTNERTCLRTGHLFVKSLLLKLGLLRHHMQHYVDQLEEYLLFTVWAESRAEYAVEVEEVVEEGGGTSRREDQRSVFAALQRDASEEHFFTNVRRKLLLEGGGGRGAQGSGGLQGEGGLTTSAPAGAQQLETVFERPLELISRLRVLVCSVCSDAELVRGNLLYQMKEVDAGFHKHKKILRTRLRQPDVASFFPFRNSGLHVI